MFFPTFFALLSAVKKRSRALPLSLWFGHEREGVWVGSKKAKTAAVGCGAEYRRGLRFFFFFFSTPNA